MRICLITEYFYPEDSGGSPSVLSQLMRHMKDRYDDLEIDVVTSNNYYRSSDGKLSRSDNWGGIHIYRVNSPRSNQPSARLRLLAGCFFSCKVVSRLFFHHNYDLVLVGTNPPSAPFVSHWVWQRYGIPYCYIIHDLYPDIAIGLKCLSKYSKIANIAGKFQRRWLYGASVNVVLGRDMRNHLIANYQVPENHIKVITNWCNSHEITPMPKETAFRKKHGLSGFLVIYAGNIGHSQGLGTILDAAKCLLTSSQSDIKFVLIGEGDAYNHVLARISDEHLTNTILLKSVPQNEYADVLASADISLVSLDPSLEGLAVPSKSYNIIASGRPMIALMNETSEVAQMIIKHQCGVQVEHGDALKLASTIFDLYNNPSAVMLMGLKARDAFLAHYTLEHIAEQYRQLFEEVTQKQG